MDIEVSVRLWMGERSPCPEDENQEIVTLPAGSTVGALLDRLGVPAAQPMILLRNDTHADAEDRLEPGDTLVILPALDGG